MIVPAPLRRQDKIAGMYWRALAVHRVNAPLPSTINAAPTGDDSARLLAKVISCEPAYKVAVIDD